eukprot:11776335-Ditylum_brightwellii.AAC.1
MFRLGDFVQLTKGVIDFYTYFDCNGLSPQAYEALVKLVDISAEHANEGMCKNDKVVFFISRGYVHVSKHANPGGGMTAMLYG